VIFTVVSLRFFRQKFLMPLENVEKALNYVNCLTNTSFKCSTCSDLSHITKITGWMLTVKSNFNEIDEGNSYIGYSEAFNIIKTNVHPLEVEELTINMCAGRIAASDLVALISYPSTDVSLKDGFAVKSADIVNADSDKPVCLTVDGAAFAGIKYEGRVKHGSAVKICSGSQIPHGADAVVSGEFCQEVSGGEVLVKADAGPGRNILHVGVEVEAGEVIVRNGEKLLPGKLGLAAAAGIDRVKVHRQPHVAIISIGDEVVAPGLKLNSGQLYASNMVTMEAWLAASGIPCVTSITSDNEANIKLNVNKHLPDADIILTSG